ncbi:deoxyribodipyrimidine photo-lyase [Mycoplasmatota bacterium]|nr:deoxyribodipyrimidine photo-lyase [Mycoplasmatota bacterium]
MRAQRLKHLKDGKNIGKYVIYWMQQSQRIHYNHALNHAVKIANKQQLPLVVYFGLYSGYPDANERSFAFMIEGMRDVKIWLERLGVNFVLRIGKSEEMIFDYLSDAHTLVMDRGYLKYQRLMRKYVLDKSINLDLAIDMVESDLIVPIEEASDKREYGAYTIRKKLLSKYQYYRDITSLDVLDNKSKLNLETQDFDNIHLVLEKFNIDHHVKKSDVYKGGYLEASKWFTHFVQHDIEDYKDRNDPSDPKLSHMSMYLHFGQISSLELLERLEIASMQKQINQASIDAFIEQLLVRRELAFNYVYYTKGYDQFEYMSQPWAYKTMKKHANDERPYIYLISDYENFNTHDKAFNAAMIEMVKTGYMHNYMRMYWAKKIIEWSKTFEEAYHHILYLNNKYFIDGRDPNSYAGVAWCFGNHDRPWKERDVFGQLRYMNAEGLKRKFNIELYIKKMKNYSN